MKHEFLLQGILTVQRFLGINRDTIRASENDHNNML